MTLQNTAKISIQTTQNGIEIPVPIQVAKAVFWLAVNQSFWFPVVFLVNLWGSFSETSRRAKIYYGIFILFLASALFGLVNPQRSVFL